MRQVRFYKTECLCIYRSYLETFIRKLNDLQLPYETNEVYGYDNTTRITIYCIRKDLKQLRELLRYMGSGIILIRK